jgi:hypothetical protein
MNDYIRSFIIGTSLITVLPFYYSTRITTYKTYKYENYILIAPLWFAIMNVLSLYIGSLFNLSLRNRLLLISIISPIIVITIAKLSNSYTFKDYRQWLYYGLRIILMHFFTYNVTIYLLESTINKIK